MPKIAPQLIIDLLITIGKSESHKETRKQLFNFLHIIGFKAQLRHSKEGVCLTLNGKNSAFSLLWRPTRQEYCPRLAGKNTNQLIGISLDTYVNIWQAFNRASRQLWRLTPFQESILNSLCQGKSLQDIALEHKLSLPSIKRYMRIIRETLGAQTNPQAVAIALRQGWISTSHQ